MFIRQTKFYYWLIILIIPAVFLAACQGINPVQNDPPPTQDVGEEPPAQIPTQLQNLPTPTAMSTQSATTQPPAWLIGPTPYPTPGGQVSALEELVDPVLVTDIVWEIYQGEFRMNDAAETWIFSFKYPSGWYIDPKADYIQVFVQNNPVTQDAELSESVKFEIVCLSAPPMLEEGLALDPNELITVEIAGESTILLSTTQQLDQRRQIKAIMQHGAGWLVATGDILLPTVDKTTMDKYSAIIYTILSTFRFDHLANTTQQPMEILNPADQKKPADSDYPTAGICEESQDNLILIKISARSVPVPRCIKVKPDQQLEFKNESVARSFMQLGTLEVLLEAGDTVFVDGWSGDYFEFGVHSFSLSQGSAPEIWLVSQ